MGKLLRSDEYGSSSVPEIFAYSEEKISHSSSVLLVSSVNSELLSEYSSVEGEMSVEDDSDNRDVYEEEEIREDELVSSSASECEAEELSD